MAKRLQLEHFKFSPDDALVSEHLAVAKWLEDVVALLGHNIYYQHVDLKALPSGKRMLDADPEQARRYVLAALAQLRHWDQLAEQIHSFFLAEAERMEPHRRLGWQPLSELDRIKALLPPEWYQVRGRLWHTAAILHALMRRVLPFQKCDLLAILQCGSLYQSPYLPLKHFIRALKRYASQMPLDFELCHAMKQFAMRLQSSSRKDVRQLGTLVEQLASPGS